MDKVDLISPGRYERILETAKHIEPLKMGNVFFQYELQPLSAASIEKAKNELRETEEVVKQALADMRELIKGEKDLYVPDDDYFFAKFLRPCKWHVKPAFELLKRFYRYKLTHPRYCINLTPKSEPSAFVNDILTPLPLRTNDGCRIVLIEGGKKWNPKKVSLDQIFRTVMMLLDAAVIEPETQVNGVHVILDMDGLFLSQVTYYTPSFANAVLEWVQKCLPTRLKGVHIINQPFIFNMVFAIFKPFLMEKLRKRVIFHGTDRKSLLKYIDARALPVRYGGELELPPESFGEKIWKYISNFEDEFIEAETYGYQSKK
ncbi:alpha-tocopherol transfer protein-like [Chelonus insularis]|uniref:alpha-tocopherol transfer protein-like n=1 Tax=Chelonus insularis TaxID=460826 RepID=UPI00158CE8FC|nr:alpha-tocopherol transfer protein-like [Chelonus insularis]